MFSKTFILGIGIAALRTQAIDIVSKADAELEADADAKLQTDAEVQWRTYIAGDHDSMEQPFYFKSDVYQEQDRVAKMNDLWYMITKDTISLPYYWAEFANAFSNNTSGSFCQDSDEMQWKRLKTAHTQGLIAKAKWVPTNQEAWPEPYTGFYAAESDQNLIRFSQTTNLTDLSGGLLPSFAFKFLINGHKSQNIFGMPSFKETDSWDFFENTMKSRLDHFVPANDDGINDQYLIDTIQVKLNTATQHPFSTAVGNIGDTNASGDELTDVKIPYELRFESPFKGHEYTQQDGREWIERLKEIGTDGAHILEVYALEIAGATPFKIADITLTSDLTTSHFGDERFHFQHVRTNKDRKYWSREIKQAARLDDPWSPRPDIDKADWEISAWPTDDDEAEDMFMEQIEQHGCPFYWLFAENPWLLQDDDDN